jgi:hypothetical protein
MEWRARLFENYIRVKDQTHRDPNDHLYVWEACVDAFKARVRADPLLELGVHRLESWWKAVEARGVFNFAAKQKLRHQLRTIEYMLARLSKDSASHHAVIESLKSCLADLSQQADDYIG